ncbi:MAG: hypothetical protein ACRD1N_01685, partial [Terriglobia bacterium]
PWTRGNPADPRVNSQVFDHTSILKLIEWRWGVPPLAARDASGDVGNLASVLNLAWPNAEAPSLPEPVAPDPVACKKALLQEVPSRTNAPSGAPTAWPGLANSSLPGGWQGRMSGKSR